MVDPEGVSMGILLMGTSACKTRRVYPLEGSCLRDIKPSSRFLCWFPWKLGTTGD